ncbi:MAG: hypothetical protein LBR25_05920 [Erysipelotrichaceae bacterium]|nr:hypothetical protein [Erysipelotrichaceae bacterium]
MESYNRDTKTARLVVLQRNNSVNQSLILFDGIAQIATKNGLLLAYKESEQRSVEVLQLSADTLQIISSNNGEKVTTRILCVRHDLAPVEISQAFGTLHFKTYTHALDFGQNALHVAYDVVVDEEVVDGFSMEWKWEECSA